LNGTTYFTAKSARYGIELWKLVGNDVVLVKDISPGERSSSFRNFINTGVLMYFMLEDEEGNKLLWRSDGTEGGTFSLKTLIPKNTLGTDVEQFAYIGNTLYFELIDTSGGGRDSQLWKTDGTVAGTVLIQTFTQMGGLSTMNNAVYFTATIAPFGTELWRSDGTLAGTTLVKDINPAGDISVKEMKVIGNALYLSLEVAGYGEQLWKTDGTDAGTILLQDTKAIGNSLLSNLTDVNGTLYFVTRVDFNNAALWKSDGLESGTVLVKSFSNMNGSIPNRLVSNNGALYFVSYDGDQDSELWVSDGTASGTKIVKDINPGGNYTSIWDLTSFNGTLYFQANDGVHGYELWKSDGTEPGTMLVKDIYVGANSSEPFSITGIGSTLYFGAQDGIHGYELWKSDGTAVGTVLVADINQSSGDTEFGEGIVVNDVYYFSANDGIHGYELWKSDGTEAGTVMLADINPGVESSLPRRFVKAGNNVFCIAQQGDSLHIFKLESATGIVTKVRTLYYTDLYDIIYMASINDILYFTDMDTTVGVELFRLNENSGQAELVRNISPGTRSTFMYNMTVVNNIIYFTTIIRSSNGTPIGFEVWRSDGSEMGTYIVKSMLNYSQPSFLRGVNNTLFFDTFNDQNIFELWKSDGTDLGTTKVKEIGPQSAGSSSTNAAGAGNDLYFTVDDGIHGRELWRSNGTENGTYLVKDIRQDEDINIESMKGMNGVLYFSVDDGIHGTELWRSDGTEAGTYLIKDLIPGSNGSHPIISAGTSKLFFDAHGATNDFNYGRELWMLVSCDLDNTHVSSTGRTEFFNNQRINTNTRCQCDFNNNLISAVEATGASPVSGDIDANVWVDNTDNPDYIKRHYELNPVTNTTTATGKVTIFFTQAEFDEYNAAVVGRSIKLPENSADISGISNIMIEKYSGDSGGKGLPDSYGSQVAYINPADADIHWNATTQRWEIAFNTTGFGGFFLMARNALTAPESVSISNNAVCSGQSIELKATCDAFATVAWYTQPSGGIAVGTGAVLQITPASTKTYYVACEYGINSSERILTGEVIVATTPTDPISVHIDKTAICGDETVSLTAYCRVGTPIWYNQATGGSAIGTGTEFGHQPMATTTYYVSCKNAHCETGRLATSEVMFTAMPIVSASVDKTTICSGVPVTLTATCSVGTLSWYTQANGGAAIGTSSPLILTPSVTTTYYAQCKNDNCIKRVATSQVVVGDALPATPGITIDKTTICMGDSITLTSSCSVGVVYWYNSATGGTTSVGNSIGTGNSLTLKPNASITYVAECRINTCVSGRTVSSAVTVKPRPSKPKIAGPTQICMGGNAELTASDVTLNALGTPVIYWTGGSTGDAIIVSPTQTSIYKAWATFDGCTSDTANAHTISVSSAIVASINAAKTSICAGDMLVISGQCSGQNASFVWSNLQTATNALTNSTARVITEPGTYKGYCENTVGCVSAVATITITQGTNCSAQGFLSVTPTKPIVCPGKSVSLTASGCSGVVTWFGGVSTQTGTTITISPTANITYMAQCSTGSYATVEVTVVAANATQTNDIVTGQRVLKATQTLESTRKIGDPDFTPGANVTFESGKSILLKPGFVAEKRSTFSAVIKACE